MAKEITEKEFEDSYEYKVVKKSLLLNFPFIKKVELDRSSDINRWSHAIYISLTIDPYMIAQMYNLKVWNVITSYLMRGESYWSPYLSIYFVTPKNDDFSKATTVEAMNVTSPIANQIQMVINGIHNSKVLPQEFKLDRSIQVGRFNVTPESLPPDITSLQN